MRETHGLQGDHIADAFHCGKMFSRLQHDLCYAHLLGMGQRVTHQRVSAFATLLRLEVVGFVEVDWIDFIFPNELLDLDRLGEFDVRFVQILVCDLDVLPFFVFIALGQIFPRNLHILGIAKSFVRHRAHILLMEEVKRKFVPARCAKQRNRNGNECEADVAFPYSSHLASPPLGPTIISIVASTYKL